MSDKQRCPTCKQRIRTPKANTAKKFKPGDEIIWLHCPPGGYGYTFRIPGKVVGYGRGRVRIEVAKVGGEKVCRFVKEESLRFGGL